MDFNKINETYKITGMTCAACAKAVERAVKKIDGVRRTKCKYSYREIKYRL